MEKVVRLGVTVEDHPDPHYPHRTLSLTFRPEDIPDWCLSLCLLEKGLIDSLIVVDNDGANGVFQLRVTLSPKLIGRGYVEWLVEGAHLLTDGVQLEVLLHFFLRYYRDGVADVSQIDVEIEPQSSNNGIGLYLALKVPASRPPMSEKELRHLLDLPPRTPM